MCENVLVVGGGGREHAIAWKLAQSPRVKTVYVAPGNAGTSTEAKTVNVSLNVKDHKSIINWCKSNDISLVAVGPEEPLVNGIADDLTAAGIKCFGPCKNAAQIEASKAFSKDFMKKYDVPTARYQSFTDAEPAKDFIRNADFPALVVKASGLAAGKGVIVAKDKHEAVSAVDLFLKDRTMGAAGDTVVIEELLEGEEISVLAFTDGKDISIMPPSQDHKRLKEGDEGPNTGGMGAYCPCPQVPDTLIELVRTSVVQKTLNGLKNEGISYVGVLYAGLMITKRGPLVLEFNCRFGDPETQPILSLLDSDLYEIMLACVNGSLNQVPILWKEDTFAVGVVLASGGYPGSYGKGKVITGLDEAKEKGVIAFHAGTNISGNQVVTSGGRVLVSLARHKDLKKAAQLALQGADIIKFENKFYRSDIAYRAISRLSKEPLTYAMAGVDIVAGDQLVKNIKSLADSTRNAGTMGSIGGFGGLFDLKAAGYKDPILVSGTDGVGTKLKVAQGFHVHNTVGIDLVAMCVNDVLVQGAEPLFFLDYFACGKLDPGVAQQVVAGVAEGCRQGGCSLLGGETAEMPGMYAPGDYDLAGFSVGAVERNKLLPRQDIKEGDIVLGFPSSGLHSNGFSLVRKVIDRAGLRYSDRAPFNKSKLLGDVLLTPTKIYVKSLLKSIQSGFIKALSHITGGGLVENIPRILPSGAGVILDSSKWNLQPVFQWIAAEGNISEPEMLKTFNCGLGMVAIVSPENAETVINNTDGEARVVGHVVTIEKDTPQVHVKNFKQTLKTAQQEASKKKVGVLISGSGTNLQALIDHVQNPDKQSIVEIALVVSNIAGVEGLKRAQRAGIPTKVISHKGYKSRVEFDMQVHQALVDSGVELICLAGFMRIISSEFVNLWLGKLINIHPALLPSFKGTHAHRQALEAGVKITGCTVHFVVPEVDAGAILLQAAVPVEPGDDEPTLQERVKRAEHRIYPEAMELLARGKVKLGPDGRLIYGDGFSS